MFKNLLTNLDAIVNVVEGTYTITTREVTTGTIRIRQITMCFIFYEKVGAKRDNKEKVKERPCKTHFT
jgi:hypothetical protein